MQPSIRRLAGADRPAPPASHDPAPPGRQRMLARLPSALVLIIGSWLIAAPFVLEYGDTGTGYNAYWNDIVVGSALISVAVVRLIAPLGTGPLSMINVLLALWLMVAPFTLDYDEGGNAAGATWNDLVVGAGVLLLAGASWYVASARHER